MYRLHPSCLRGTCHRQAVFSAILGVNTIEGATKKRTPEADSNGSVLLVDVVLDNVDTQRAAERKAAEFAINSQPFFSTGLGSDMLASIISMLEQRIA